MATVGGDERSGMGMDVTGVRREVIRRVRYALNTLAIHDDTLPPEGPYDTALTNGLVAIVAREWPGAEFDKKGRTLPASALLNYIADVGGSQWVAVDVVRLQEALSLTQPLRHGRSDDEWDSIGHGHVEALLRLDEHPALRILGEARRTPHYGDLVYELFKDRAGDELPFYPKDRSLVPDPEDCPECWRPTFLREGWDMYGGEFSEGACIACGYERSTAEASDLADREWFRRQMEKGD